MRSTPAPAITFTKAWLYQNRASLGGSTSQRQPFHVPTTHVSPIARSPSPTPSTTRPRRTGDPRTDPTISSTVTLTISILNRVARRTKQSSQDNAAPGTSAEPRKDLVRSALRFLAGREASRTIQTEDIHRTLRSPLSSAAHRHSRITPGSDRLERP